MTKEIVPEGESLWLIEQTSTVDGVRRFWNGAGFGWDALKAARYPTKAAAEEVSRTGHWRSFNCEMSDVHGRPEVCEHLFQCGITPLTSAEQKAARYREWLVQALEIAAEWQQAASAVVPNPNIDPRILAIRKGMV